MTRSEGIGRQLLPHEPDHETTAEMSYPSLAPYIQKRPWLMRWMRPLSEWYFDNAGYRKLGLRYALSWHDGNKSADKAGGCGGDLC